MRFLTVVAVVCLFVALAVCPACAQGPVTLVDGNSTFTVDPTSDSGATVWTLDDIDQLFQQQWYYRLADGQVLSINNLGTPVVNLAAGGQSVDVKYQANSFDVTLAYTLYGGAAGSSASDVSEIFRIQNTSDCTLYFDLFEYSDFNLQPLDNDDYAAHVNANAISQWDGTHVVTESVVRTPDHWQIGNPFVITGDLSDGAAFIGPTDCAWAFQWNLVVPTGGSVVFSKDKAFTTSIPEPMSVVLGIMGLSAVSGFRRLRRK